MPKVKNIQKLSISKACVMLTRLDRIMLPDEVICIQRQVLNSYRDKKGKTEKVPVFALVPWELFEQMWEVTNTIEDKLQMMEFIKFMRDSSKTHVFTDILRKFYTEQGYDESADEFDSRLEAVSEPEKEYPVWVKGAHKRKKKEDYSSEV